MILYDNDAYREKFMEIVYGILSSDETNDRANQIIDAFDDAPQVEVKELPVNDPLTLEQLRGMNGEPVWIVGDDDSDIECNGYAVLGIVPADWLYLWWYGVEIAATPQIKNYGKSWCAYRRKPEEQPC